MADLKDLFPSQASMNAVTESVQQPPGGKVTEVHDKSVEANTINQAEASQQEMKQAIAVEAKEAEVTDSSYYYEIENAHHKVVVRPVSGPYNYNFHAKCACHWEGRYLTSGEAEEGAKRHISRNMSPKR